MNTAICSKIWHRRGAKIPASHNYGSAAEKQRNYQVFEQTLRAEVFLVLCFVAPRSQIRADIPHHFAHKTKNPLTGGIPGFLTGCWRKGLMRMPVDSGWARN